LTAPVNSLTPFCSFSSPPPPRTPWLDSLLPISHSVSVFQKSMCFQSGGNIVSATLATTPEYGFLCGFCYVLPRTPIPPVDPVHDLPPISFPLFFSFTPTKCPFLCPLRPVLGESNSTSSMGLHVRVETCQKGILTVPLKFPKVPK